MAPRRKVRRTSSLPGLASDDPTGLSTAMAPVVLPSPMPIPIPMPMTSLPPPAAGPPPAYSFTFTTNLTPITFQHSDKTEQLPGSSLVGPPSPANSTSSVSRKRNADALEESAASTSSAAAAQEPTPAAPAPARSTAHTRKFSVGHIPRPPNAFILFRSDLVARKAVPTSLEADHSTISKIIGVCWRTLPARQRKRWEQKALEAKAAHKKLYPDYRYTPVHRKGGPSRKKAKREQKKDDARCEELAQMLLSGSKGADLEARVRKHDEANPDSYQTTLNFNAPSSPAPEYPGGGYVNSQQQFTFVQGFPAAGHSIQVPSAPNMSLGAPYYYASGRRHSSAPPADLGGNASSSSTASTPRTPARDLSTDTTTTTDGLVPSLSRISRKLPTKSTHHLQPHHFHQEAQVLAAAAAAAGGGSSRDGGGAATGKKIKSSIAKSVRSRAQGFGAPQPASERDQLFIQSHWSAAATDPNAVPGDGKKQRRKKAPIPSEMIVPTWDLNAPQNSMSNGAGGAYGEYASAQASPIMGHHSAPQAIPSIPGFISAEHYSPVYDEDADNKYGGPGSLVGSFQDPSGLAGLPGGPFDMIAYDYGLPGMGGTDSFAGIDMVDTAALDAALNGFGAVSGFDFADQFGALGVDGGASGNSGPDDYGYSAYPLAASGANSTDSTSPHTSDADEAAAFHPYDIPGPLTMVAQDPLGVIGAASSAPSYGGAPPDWSAFDGSTATSPATTRTSTTSTTQTHTSSSASSVPQEIDPLDPLSGARPSSMAHAFESFVYPPLPSSGPPSECGDLEDQSPVIHHLQHHHHHHHQQIAPPPPPPMMRGGGGGQQPMRLSLNMHYVNNGSPGSQPGSAASYDFSHAHALEYAQQQQYSPASASAASPLTGDVADQMNRFTMGMPYGMASHSSPAIAAVGGSPVVYHIPHHSHSHSHSQGHGGPTMMMMGPPMQKYHVQQSPMMVAQHVTPQHMHTHSHSHSMDSFQDTLPSPMGNQPQQQQQQWGEWTHPDPFRSTEHDQDRGLAHSVSGGPIMVGNLDPLTAPGMEPYRA